MSTATLGSPITVRDYTNPSDLKKCYDDNMECGRYDFALRNAGQQARQSDEISKQREWVENFTRTIVAADGKIGSSILLEQFGRFWHHPVFRAPESLIEAGKRLTGIIDKLPPDVHPYVGQLLLQGLAEMRTKKIPTLKIAEAKSCLQALLRRGFPITDAETRLSVPVIERDVVLKNSPAVHIRLITRNDADPRFLIMEQTVPVLTPKLAFQIFADHWPADFAIQRKSVRQAMILTLGFGFDETAPTAAVYMNPLSPDGFFVPSSADFVKDQTGYFVPDWSAIAEDFVASGGLNFPAEFIEIAEIIEKI